MNNLQEPRTRLHISGTTPYLIGAKESNQIKRLQTLETFSVSTSFSTHFFSSWSDRILFLLVFLSRETRIFVCVHCFQPSHFFALSLSLSLPPCSPRNVTHNELCHTFSVAIWTSCLMMIHRGKTACLYYSQKIYINVHKHTQMCRILGSFDGTIPTWLALKRAHRSSGQRASDTRSALRSSTLQSASALGEWSYLPAHLAVLCHILLLQLSDYFLLPVTAYTYTQIHIDANAQGWREDYPINSRYPCAMFLKTWQCSGTLTSCWQLRCRTQHFLIRRPCNSSYCNLSHHN